MHEFILKNSNSRMRYHDFPADGIPILFIHGLGCTGSFEYPQVAAQRVLSENRRILVDLLGSGYSDKPDDFGYRVEDHAEYLLDFVAKLELDKFILYGHSLGGAVALSLADHCRDRLEGIILSEANLDKGGGFITSAIAGYTMEDFIHQGFQNMILKNQMASKTMWAASFSVSSPKAMYLISQSAVEGTTPSWREILYSLDCRKTFIFGEKSLPDPDREELANHGLRIEIVSNAGHAMAWENPEGLAAAIKNSL